MKEKIIQLSKLQFEYKKSNLILFPESIEKTVKIGDTVIDYINIKNTETVPMKAIIYSSSDKIILKEDRFLGTEGKIQYEINTQDITEEQEICATITIVSNLGERELACCIKIEQVDYISQYGTIRDLDDFAELAKEDWEEARKLFLNKLFMKKKILLDSKNKLLYKGLIKSTSSSGALEEFLYSMKKKEMLYFSMSHTIKKYQVKQTLFQDYVVLIKNTWGYEEIEINTDADFILLDKKRITTKEFLGNTYQISYVIQSDKIRTGKHYGKLYIKTIHQNLQVDIFCKKEIKKEKIYSNFRKNYYKLEITKNYLEFRLGKISLKKYTTDSELLLYNLAIIDENYLYDLLKTHLYIMSNNVDQVKDMLGRFDYNRKQLLEESVKDYCGYLYLRALYLKSDKVIQDAVADIKRYYIETGRDFQLLWYLLYLDKKYDHNKGAKLEQLKQQFESNCTSPVLYFEVCTIYNMDVSFLRELGRFELQVINWGIRENYLNQEAILKITYLSGKEKIFKKLLFHILVQLYKKNPLDEILFALCSHLIKGQKIDKKYFCWYKLGVKAQLRITELHEYYMYTIDEETESELLQSIYLYFIYNNTLSEQKKAYLYACVIKEKEKNKATYDTYKKIIEQFGLKQIKKHNINDNLAIIYKDLLKNKWILEQVILDLPSILFRYEVICDNANIKGVIVLHNELDYEQQVPLTKGVAYINLYTSHTKILLYDSDNRRYNITVSYSVRNLLPIETYQYICYEETKEEPMLLLSLYEKLKTPLKIEDYVVPVYEKMLHIQQLKKSIIQEIQFQLLNYYYETLNWNSLDRILEKFDLNTIIDRKKRNTVIEICITRGLFEKAIKTIKKFGYYEIKVESLLKLANYFIILEEQEINLDLLNLCQFLINLGEYNEQVVQYLIAVFLGPTEEMIYIWNISTKFTVDAGLLEERILVQILFSESKLIKSIPIFISYYKKALNYKIITAYLNYNCYQYFIRDILINFELIPILEDELKKEQNDLWMLTLLKYYSIQEQLKQDKIQFVEDTIAYFIKRNMIFPIFLQLQKYTALPSYITDKYYIEFYSNSNKRIMIHYCITDKMEKEKYMVEEMKQVYLGIYIKPVILFYKETLRYYIIEEDLEKPLLQNTICLENKKIVEKREANVYDRLNAILYAQEEEDVIETLEAFITDRYLINQLFRPL